MSKSITQLKKWNLIAGGNDPKNDVIPANVCEGLEAALQIAITEILRLEARIKRLEDAGDDLHFGWIDGYMNQRRLDEWLKAKEVK